MLRLGPGARTDGRTSAAAAGGGQSRTSRACTAGPPALLSAGCWHWQTDGHSHSPNSGCPAGGPPLTARRERREARCGGQNRETACSCPRRGSSVSGTECRSTSGCRVRTQHRWLLGQIAQLAEVNPRVVLGIAARTAGTPQTGRSRRRLAGWEKSPQLRLSALKLLTAPGYRLITISLKKTENGTRQRRGKGFKKVRAHTFP